MLFTLISTPHPSLPVLYLITSIIHFYIISVNINMLYRGYEVKNWERGMGSRDEGKQHINVYRDDVEVDYRGYEVMNRESGYRGKGGKQ
jgi:hypothetical protein